MKKLIAHSATSLLLATSAVSAQPAAGDVVLPNRLSDNNIMNGLAAMGATIEKTSVDIINQRSAEKCGDLKPVVLTASGALGGKLARGNPVAQLNTTIGLRQDGRYACLQPAMPQGVVAVTEMDGAIHINPAFAKAAPALVALAGQRSLPGQRMAALPLALPGKVFNLAFYQLDLAKPVATAVNEAMADLAKSQAYASFSLSHCSPTQDPTPANFKANSGKPGGDRELYGLSITTAFGGLDFVGNAHLPMTLSFASLQPRDRQTATAALAALQAKGIVACYSREVTALHNTQTAFAVYKPLASGPVKGVVALSGLSWPHDLPRQPYTAAAAGPHTVIPMHGALNNVFQWLAYHPEAYRTMQAWHNYDVTTFRNAQGRPLSKVPSQITGITAPVKP